GVKVKLEAHGSALLYSALCGAGARPKVTTLSASAPSEHTVMVATIGNAVPSKNALTITITTPPATICSVPPSAHAMPAIGQCSSSASTMVDGMTKPRQAKAQNSTPISSSRLSGTSSVTTSKITEKTA